MRALHVLCVKELLITGHPSCHVSVIKPPQLIVYIDCPHAAVVANSNLDKWTWRQDMTPSPHTSASATQSSFAQQWHRPELCFPLQAFSLSSRPSSASQSHHQTCTAAHRRQLPMHLHLPRTGWTPRCLTQEGSVSSMHHFRTGRAVPSG